MSRFYSRTLPGLLLSALSLLSLTPARASHIMGGQISYTSLGNNLYRVRIERYVDLTSAASADRNLTLVCKKNDCTSLAAGSFTVPLVINSTTNASLNCSSNYQLQRVETTVTLPPAQWQLAINEENRASGTNNLVTPDMRSMYLAATLDNTRSQADSSPQFTELELPSVPAQMNSNYSFSAFDADGDSLAYQLVAAQFSAQNNNTTPTTYPCPNDLFYGPYSAGSFVDPGTGQPASYSAGTYSAALPLPSFRLTNGVAAPWIDLDAMTGRLQSAPAQLGRYAVAVRVNEYRRLGGAPVLIGSVTRELTYFVQASTNRNPMLLVSRTMGGLGIGQSLDVVPGERVLLTFSATDPDPGQTLTLSSTVASLLPGASFQVTGRTADFDWTVPTSGVSGYYAFSVRVVDNACPLPGSDTRTVVLHIVGGRPTATTSGRPLTALPAYPVPFTKQVTLRLPAAGVQPVLITDALGRAVARLHTQPDGSLTWQPEHLTAGVYFARTADGQQVARLVKAD